MLFRLIILAFIPLAASEHSLRLPNNTKPISYNIHLTTNIHISKWDYNGVVSITLETVQDTNEIVIHAGENIKINKVNLIDQEKGFEIGRNLNYSRDSSNDLLTIFSAEEPLQLKKGKQFLLTLSFNGIHQDIERGFYRSGYITSDLNEVWIASTFFEPIYARVAFPCYDEPMFKAKFSTAITHGANFTALSNMPADGDPIELGAGMITTKFKETPSMSVYTLAFVVGNYNNISVQYRNITHRIYSLPSSEYKGEFSLDLASKSLHAYDSYFGVNFPLPKIDHISVPQYPADAMENWGLVIHNSKYLLTYSNSSKKHNLYTGVVIVHETAHQWFGNLVTPKWWNNVWLSEGLSTFYTNKILEILHPEWNPTEYVIIEECGNYWDEREFRPMTQYVEMESDIWQTFEKIFYCKGDKIMRMFEHALTNSTLKKGVIAYLNKYKYSNAEEGDLFECLQIAACEDKIPEFEKPGTVNKVMSSWTKQMDFPRIFVQRDYKSGTFKLVQSPIGIEHAGIIKGTRPAKNELWWIPVTFATASEPNFDDTRTDLIFANEQNFIVDPLLLNKTLLMDDWLILNKHQIGLYQVIYDERNWNLIIEALKKNPNLIPSYNKMQLIRDAGYFESNSLLSSKILYNLLSYLENEEDILPWFEAFKVMDKILENFRGTRGAEYFNFFARNITSNIVDKIGLDPKDSDTATMEIFRRKLSLFIYIIGDE